MENKVFSEKDDFNSFLQEQAATDVWERCQVDHMEIFPLANNPICMQTIKDEMNLKSPDEVVRKAMEGTGLVLKFPASKWYKEPINESAVRTIFQRAGLSGSVFRKTTPEDNASMLNLALKYWGCNALVLKRDDMIHAVHAGDPNDYSILPINELVEALEEKMEAYFPGYEFNGGYVTDDITYSQYAFPKQQNKIIDEYNKLITNVGGKPINDFLPQICLLSSDTGCSAAKIYPTLTKGKEVIFLGHPMELTHKSKHSINDFKEICDQIYSIYTSSFAKLDNMMHTTICNPVGCFKLIAKKIRLPKSTVLEAAELFGLKSDGVDITAHDIYWALWDIISFLRGDGVSPDKLVSYSEDISKTISFKWEEYDRPFEWE